MQGEKRLPQSPRACYYTNHQFWLNTHLLHVSPTVFSGALEWVTGDTVAATGDYPVGAKACYPRGWVAAHDSICLKLADSTTSPSILTRPGKITAQTLLRGRRVHQVGKDDSRLWGSSRSSVRRSIVEG